MSVLICTRDRPTLAAGAVANALAQEHVALEVLVVDHASDPPVTLPPDLATDSRVRVVRAGPDLSLGAVRNLAIREATADLVAFLDDDDRFRPGKLARQVRELAAAPPEVAVIESGYELWDDGQLAHRYAPGPGARAPGDLLRGPRLQPSTVLVRRQAILDVGGFDPARSRTEDWELWLRLTDRYRVRTLPDVLTDRVFQPADPAPRLAAYTTMLADLGPRIEAQGGWTRRRLRSHHALTRAILLAGTGRPGAAATGMLAAWARAPWSLRPLAHLLRLLVGERRWAHVATRARRARYGF